MPPLTTTTTTTTILNRLKSFPSPPPPPSIPPSSLAAVLVGLVENDRGVLEVVLTKRAEGLRTHGGEVALPGGKMDEEDEDLAYTAKREAMEEIGLPMECVEIIKAFPPSISKHGLLVTPIVSLLPRTCLRDLQPNPAEVDSIFTVPLEFFLKKEGEEVHSYMSATGVEWKFHTFWYEDERGRRFGLTAFILVEIAVVAFGREPEFERLGLGVRPTLETAEKYGIAKKAGL
ncbi:hypothetical protein HDV05_008114 [Chytridiales sp. JEL 0842]|nr:hypothetical protein HDV05_008114 [Chytridiales sp. JEL 0842]